MAEKTMEECLSMAESLLKEYDLYHSSLLYGGKITFNINYLNDGNVYVSLVGLIRGEEKKTTCDFQDNNDFNRTIFPKIVERFLSKNVGIKSRKIMAGEETGTFVIESKNGKDSLIIRNCSSDIMEISQRLINALSNLNDINYNGENRIIIQSDSNELYDSYMKYNLVFDYATYKALYFRSNSNLALDIENSINGEDDNSGVQLLVLNIARYAYMFAGSEKENLWDEIKNVYKGKKAVEDICDAYKNLSLEEDSVYMDALILAEFEKNHDMFLHTNDGLVQEASAAVLEGVSFFNDSYVDYFKKKQEYYTSMMDTQHEIICLDFIDSRAIGYTLQSVELRNKSDNLIPKKRSAFDVFREIHEKRLAFDEMLSEPLEEESDGHYKIDDFDSIYGGAEDQARIIFDIIQERDQIKRDAEEFAKQIIKKEKEYKEIFDASLEQAKKIIELENENKLLKQLAKENAQELFDRDIRLREEIDQRQVEDNTPVNIKDIDKINTLLNSIVNCKDIDFAINHPTIMEQLSVLEEKIITYLSTHNNIVNVDGTIILPVEKEEMTETKPVIELIEMIRNAYDSSHEYEKYGRHTVIDFTPVDEDTYRCSLYSVKDEDDDILMDVFFEEYQLTDSVIEQLCNIFKRNAIIVASKTDNVPPDKADYLVIDNMNNAFKFTGCNRKLIDTIKQYL